MKDRSPHLLSIQYIGLGNKVLVGGGESVGSNASMWRGGGCVGSPGDGVARFCPSFFCVV